jgi:hypothetical protein
MAILLAANVGHEAILPGVPTWVYFPRQAAIDPGRQLDRPMGFTLLRVPCSAPATAILATAIEATALVEMVNEDLGHE